MGISELFQISNHQFILPVPTTGTRAHLPTSLPPRGRTRGTPCPTPFVDIVPKKLTSLGLENRANIQYSLSRSFEQKLHDSLHEPDGAFRRCNKYDEAEIAFLVNVVCFAPATHGPIPQKNVF